MASKAIRGVRCRILIEPIARFTLSLVGQQDTYVPRISGDEPLLLAYLNHVCLAICHQISLFKCSKSSFLFVLESFWLSLASMTLLASSQDFCMTIRYKLMLRRALGNPSWFSKETLSEVVLPFVTVRCVVKAVCVKLGGQVI